MSVAAAPQMRTRPLRRNASLTALGGLLVAVVWAGVVHAYWTAPGSGFGSGPVGTLTVPTLGGAPGAGTATLTWTAVTPPGSGPVTYYVQRNGANPAGNCPTQAAPTSVLSCTDTGLIKGSYTYTATAVWRSWTATSSPAQVTLASGALHHFLLAVATTTPTAGQADNLTITAMDSAGNTVTTYSGSHTLSFSGASSAGTFTPKVTNTSGTAINFGAATAINFVAGVSTVAGGSNGAMTLYKAETITVSVTDTSISGTSASISVSPAAANKLVFTQSPGNTVAGVAFALQPRVTVQDQFGNTATGDVSTVTLTIKAGTPTSGGPGSVTGCLESETGGVITFGGCTITTAGTGYQLHATDGSLTSADSGAFNITPAAANKLAFTQSPGNTVAGVAFAPQPQVTVQDQFGNTVTSDVSTVTLTIKAGTPMSGGPGSVTGCSQSESAGVITFSGCTIAPAGIGYQLHATDGGLTAADSGAFNITPAAANRLAFTQSPGNTVAGVAFAPQPQVTVQDQYGNTVTGDSSGVTIAVTGGSATLSGCAANAKAAVNGVATFSGCTLTKAGTYTLTATDGALASAVSASFNITPAPASKLVFTQSPGNTVAGVAFAQQPQVTVQDQFGNTVTSDSSDVTIAVTGGSATLSGCAANPRAAVNGVATFGSCTITKAGMYTLTATDGSLTSAVSGTFNITPAAANKLAFAQSPGNTAAGVAFAPQPQVTVQDQYGNTVTGDSSNVRIAVTGGSATLSGCAANPRAAVNGVATFSGCTLTKAGTYTLTATDGALISAVSSSFTISATVSFSSGPALAADNYLPTSVRGSGFNGSVTISWSYAWGGYVYSTTTAADGSGNFAWNGEENCVDGNNVYRNTDQTVIVNATDGTHTATGTGILLCSLRPRHP